MAASDGGTLVVLQSCLPLLGATLGAPLALTAPDPGNGGLENAIAVPTETQSLASNFLAYMPIYAAAPKKCVKLDERFVLLPNGASPTGVSVFSGAGTEAFASHAGGFSSVAFDGSSFASSSVDYSGTAPLYAPAAPALEQDGGVLADGGAGDGGAPMPLFGAYSDASLDGGSAVIRSADEGSCSVVASQCWKTDPGSPAVSIRVSHTPLFAGGYGFATDDSGAVQAFNLGTGVAVGAATAAGPRTSPPLLLGDKPPPDNALVAVQANGLVDLGPLPSTKAPAALPQFLTVGSFASGRPPTPVADQRGTGSVIYVIDGGCAAGPGATPGTNCGASWVWALQSDARPLAASSTAWVRPGRDTCNTRNAQAACP